MGHLNYKHFTLGVEEEYMVIDPESRELRSHEQKIVTEGQKVIKDKVKAEMHQAVVEVGTDICQDIDEAYNDVATLRGTISQIAGDLGLWVGASGTHPFSHWESQLITDHVRYNQIVNELQEAARSNLIFGLHVHVGMEDRKMAIHIANSARYFLPHVYALSTNSPFWEARKTGYKSFRTKVFDKFPRTGIPDYFESIFRDVVQNHLLQVLANLAMEPPAGRDEESVRDEKVKVLKAIPALDPQALVRGQFRGYRGEPGVSPSSGVETFAALRLEIQSWRWQGVPFTIRTGKCLPVTCTEAVVTLRRPPPVYVAVPPANHLRFRLGPDASIALGAMVKRPAEELAGDPVELLLSHQERPEEADAYELLLGDAMQGEPFHFAREDSVEEAWRIVQPALAPGLPLLEYEPGTWGPTAAAALAAPGGWRDPGAPDGRVLYSAAE